MAGRRFFVFAVTAISTLSLGTSFSLGKIIEVNTASVQSLDGSGWAIATDPNNIGRNEKWYEAVRPEAKPTVVPSIIQIPFPGYHGVAWYWKEFAAPINPNKQGRYILKLWAVDYKADVWVNGVSVGEHEGGETPFECDVTAAVNPGKYNLLAVRVLNPTEEPIDGIVLNETPHRNKVMKYNAGSSFNQGGIVDSVELTTAPAVRIVDVFVQPDRNTGKIPVEITVRNACEKEVSGEMTMAVSPAAGGATVDVQLHKVKLASGDTLVQGELTVPNPRLWQLDDPYLYRVTAAVEIGKFNSRDESSLKCGFREFVFKDGYFRLNGKRLFIKGSHTGNHFPIGVCLPPDPDMVRRDLLNCKAMGFNMTRYIAGLPMRAQLDYADEIGMLVYEEPTSSWCMDFSPRFDERFDQSVREMVLRDRNHASVVIWCLLNETHNGAVVRHSVRSLDLVRALDPGRMVVLGSGRWDNLQNSSAALPKEIQGWGMGIGINPCVLFNPSERTIEAAGAMWSAGRLGMLPGLERDDTTVRWVAPAKGTFEITAKFSDIAAKGTTSDVTVTHNGKELFKGFLNLKGQGKEQTYTGSISAEVGDTIDFMVGYGDSDWVQPYGMRGFLNDGVGLEATIRGADGKEYNPAKDFSDKSNACGVWQYGVLAYVGKNKESIFQPFDTPLCGEIPPVGAISNPGSKVWENVIDDCHYYPHTPHDTDTMNLLRTYNYGRALYFTEYGIGSGVNWYRLFNQYQQHGYPEVEDAQFSKKNRDLFLADYDRWKMVEVFGRPEAFFEQSLARMAQQRILGISALRSNPYMVGHNVTGTVDQGMTGEGVTATFFREPKSGVTDAMFDVWSPLRWCLFAEPWSVRRGEKIKLEAVLSNEDMLRPGDYPVHLWVFDSDQRAVWERTMTVTIADSKASGEKPFSISMFKEDVPVDMPTGTYDFVVSFESGAAATGGRTTFYVIDPADMPQVKHEVVMWGEDAALTKWLSDHGITVRAFDPAVHEKRELLLVTDKAASPGGSAAFGDLAKRIASGSAAVFLSPTVFAKDKDSAGWIPLANKPVQTNTGRWLYHSDDWAKKHPIFDGLQSGGMLDMNYYREMLPNATWSGGDVPAQAVAGANDVSWNYQSGLSVAVYKLGAGEFILNTMQIHKKFEYEPQAERLLRNMLNYAGRELDKPAAELPKDFDATLKSFGY